MHLRIIKHTKVLPYEIPDLSAKANIRAATSKAPQPSQTLSKFMTKDISNHEFYSSLLPGYVAAF